MTESIRTNVEDLKKQSSKLPIKSIDNLVSDIYALFQNDDIKLSDDNVSEFGRRLAQHVHNRINESRGRPSLRVSNLGLPDRKLWFTVNKPEESEPLTPATRVKFLFGDILEELLLFLAKEAGHSVEGAQGEVEIAGVKGHRDAVIDGRTVDAKSASSYAFKKFAANGLREDDPFGYLDQLGGYMYAAKDDPLVTDKDVGSFLVIDKQLGHITLDTYPRTDKDYDQVVAHKREVLQRDAPPAELCYQPVPEGKSGNMKLPVGCSYCSHKWSCHKDLRAFIYSTGPTYLTKVKAVPRVVEVDKNGETVYKF